MSCSLHPPPGFLQRRQRVAAGEDEIADACGAKRGFLVAGTSCQIDMPCARALKGPCGDNRMAGIRLVGGTQAGHCRARSAERGSKRSGVGKSPAVDGLNTAGLEEAFR